LKIKYEILFVAKARLKMQLLLNSYDINLSLDQNYI